jgi:undecaprenyl-diphosphatase
MTIFESIVLGLVQGLSEFLPISSSGHLAALQYFFDIDPEKVLFFAVMLHFGTLVSIFIAYRKDVAALLAEFVALLKDIFTGKGLNVNKNETRRLGVMIVVATIPTAIIGLLFNDAFGALYGSLLAIGIGLLITGTSLWFADKVGGGNIGVMKMNYRNALFIGICQGIAICPGISRSGSTMVGGLACKFDRAHAVRFAFLISIPSVLGAFILELPDALKAGVDGGDMLSIVVGMVVAAISGFAAIKLMIRVVTNQKLYYFSFYTWAVGALLVGYSILNG